VIVLNSVKNVDDVSDFWGTFAVHLREGIDEHGLNKFLQWGFVKTCMVHDIKPAALKKLQNSLAWDDLNDCVYEDDFGSPENNKNLLHQAYSLMEFGLTQFQDIKSIYEFGGGYGCMCKLIYRLGFKGVYTIRDLPIINHLQKIYFSGIGLKEKVTQVISDDYSPSVDLFIAMWSLSETPFKARDQILSRIKFNKCLIGFQKKFYGYNNLKYFKGLVKLMPEYKWTMYEIKHLPNNYYLYGEKK